MDYFQGVVTEFLRSDRAVFVNPECLIALDEKAPAKGRHWYCDALAVNFGQKAAYLCEVSYSKTLHALLKRLGAWDANWTEICRAISRDNKVPKDWTVHPWIFIPEKHLDHYNKKLSQYVLPREKNSQMPQPRVTLLEHVAPWQYEWERTSDYLVSG